MELEQLERHGHAWGSELTTLGFAGHINVASGFGRWDKGYELFDHLFRNAAGSSAAAQPAIGHPSRLDLPPRPAARHTGHPRQA
jgi:hypothetical protein